MPRKLTKAQLAKIHASRKMATKKTKTIFSRKFGNTTIMAKTKRGAKLLREVKSLKEFDKKTQDMGN
jgi:hypothetical protein